MTSIKDALDSDTARNEPVDEVTLAGRLHSRSTDGDTSCGSHRVGAWTQAGISGAGIWVGVCLDWIRRILSGKPPKPSGSFVYHSSTFDSLDRRRERWIDKARLAHELWRKATSEITGHDVAFHRTASGSVMCFDPNFGEFSFNADELHVLGRFIVDSWKVCYHAGKVIVGGITYHKT